IKVIKRSNPDIINYGTPKASLIISIAAKVLKVPNRIYTCHGLRYETLTGIKRRMLILSEKIIIKNSTKVLSVSQSVEDTLKMISKETSNKFELIYKKGSCN